MSPAGRAMVPLPEGFGVTFDDDVRFFHGGTVLWGGAQARVLRLTPAGRRALRSLTTGRVSDRPTGLLARRLVDAGLAHPRPPGSADLTVTVVVPVRDQTADLARCLASLGRKTAVLVVDDGSAEPAPVADVCTYFGARVLRRPVPGGPAAARNTALPGVDTDLVAFLDSDCVAPPDWVDAVSGHFLDPRVGACAPRVVGCSRQDVTGPQVRSPLDLGTQPAAVAPMGRVSYLPSAAVVVRRTALGDGFDEDLRYGEDVDLLWRLVDAGWCVRYDPATEVRHAEPDSRRAALVRRFRYGTSAAPLSRRHPGRLAPLVLHPSSAAVLASLAVGSPAVATLAAAGTTAWIATQLTRADVPLRHGVRIGAESLGKSFLGTAHTATQLYLPATVAAAVATRGWRRAAALALLATGLRNPGHAFDDLAYGLGVWRGCLTERTAAPLLPRLRHHHSSK